MKIKTRFIYLPIALVISTLVIASNLLIANGLPSDIIRSQTADKITVAIRGGGEASGVIIKRNGDTYTILTCAHSVRDLNGNGIVVTPDRQEHSFTIKSVKMISGVDLAEISFKSNRSYTLAIVSKSMVSKGDAIYVSGWPDSKRERIFAAGKIISTDHHGKDGYDLTYTNTGIRGVSGGPVLNQDAKLVGIHGKAESSEVDGYPLYSGIPIERYSRGGRSINNTSTSSTSIVNSKKVPNRVVTLNPKKKVPNLPENIQTRRTVSRASQLEFWKFDLSQNRLYFKTSTGVQPKAIMLYNPTRLIIDLPGIRFSRPTITESLSGDYVSLKIEQFDDSTTRLTLELQKGLTLNPKRVEFTGENPVDWYVSLPQPEQGGILN